MSHSSHRLSSLPSSLPHNPCHLSGPLSFNFFQSRLQAPLATALSSSSVPWLLLSPLLSPRASLFISSSMSPRPQEGSDLSKGFPQDPDKTRHLQEAGYIRRELQDWYLSIWSGRNLTAINIRNTEYAQHFSVKDLRVEWARKQKCREFQGVVCPKSHKSLAQVGIKMQVAWPWVQFLMMRTVASKPSLNDQQEYQATALNIILRSPRQPPFQMVCAVNNTRNLMHNTAPAKPGLKNTALDIAATQGHRNIRESTPSQSKVATYRHW